MVDFALEQSTGLIQIAAGVKQAIDLGAVQFVQIGEGVMAGGVSGVTGNIVPFGFAKAEEITGREGANSRSRKSHLCGD
jgi:acyl-[acyl carrier protein]--UDP-N-acetylglucosamine O-acyltransferase